MAVELLKPSDFSLDALAKNCSGEGSHASYLHSVVYSLVIGQNNIDESIQDLKEFICKSPSAATTFLDCIWLVENEVLYSPGQNSKQHRERLVSIVRGLSQVIPSLVKERLDPELLEASKIIPSKDQFSQKIVRVKTRLFYKQQKFNLLREESEGYSKLIAELANPVFGASRDFSKSADYVRSLIGCFGLDPNRAIDLILEYFVLDLEHTDFFIELLRSIINDTASVTQIFGRKFATADDTEAVATAAARLLHRKLIDMDILYAHLSPNDADITAKIQADFNEAKQKASKLNVINFAAKSEDDGSGNAGHKDDGDKAANGDIPAFYTNHKLLLLRALLLEGSWQEACSLLDHLTPAYAMAEPAVSLALAQFLTAMIAPMSQTSNGLPEQLTANMGSSSTKHLEKLPKLDESKLCSSYEDMLSKDFFGILFYIGPYLSRDSVLMTQLLRIFQSFISTINPTKLTSGTWEAKFYFSMVTAFDDAILPSLSLMPSNCVISESIWSVLKHMPYLHRYSLYGAWLSDAYLNLTPLINMKVAVIEKCRYSVKRVTKDNFKQIGRQLGKLSHANPGPVVEHLLNTVQRYDNLIGPLIDSLRYMTQMSFDVITYCVMRTLAAQSYDSDGTAALCSFTGQLVRRYNCEIAGLLQLVSNQLKLGTCDVDLALLREIVQKMAGIEPFEDATDDQLEATMGGDLLKSELGNLCQLRALKRPAQRLRDSLSDASLATPVFLLVAKHRPTTVYKSPLNTHLKTLGKLFDNCQETLLQYGTFLSNVLTTTEYANNVPTITSLLSEYKVPPDSAFFMARPTLAGKLNEQTKAVAKQLLVQVTKDGTKPDKEGVEKLRTRAFSEAARALFSELTESFLATSPGCFPSNLWQELSCDLYVVFWTLDISDIYVPDAAYDRLESQLRSQLKTAESDFTAASSGNSSSGTVKNKAKERDRLRSYLDRVVDERSRQRDHVARVMACLKAMKDQFFPTELLKRDIIANFLQYCIFPRLLFSQPDALYCAKFISLLHSMLLSNFSTVHCLDRIFSDITYVMSSLSEAESRRYGRFVAACLDLVLQWHGSREVYNRECGTRFIISQSNSVKTPLDYENFRHLCHKWNYRISKAMVSCLESGQYVQIRNALLVLTKLLPVYPKLSNHGQALEQRADRLSRAEKEHRADLYQLAFAYGGQLRAKKSTWLPEREFHLTADAGKTAGKITPGAGRATASGAGSTANNADSGKDGHKGSSKASETSKRTAPVSANADGVSGKRSTANDSVATTNPSNASTPQRQTNEEPNGHGRDDPKRRRLENGQTSTANSPTHNSSVNGVSNTNTTSTGKKHSSISVLKESSRSRDGRKRTSPTERHSDAVPLKQASAGSHSPSPALDSPAHQNSRQGRGSSKGSSIRQSASTHSRGSARRH